MGLLAKVVDDLYRESHSAAKWEQGAKFVSPCVQVLSPIGGAIFQSWIVAFVLAFIALVISGIITWYAFELKAVETKDLKELKTKLVAYWGTRSRTKKSV